jgi:hypothetical protein
MTAAADALNGLHQGETSPAAQLTRRELGSSGNRRDPPRRCTGWSFATTTRPLRRSLSFVLVFLSNRPSHKLVEPV